MKTTTVTTALRSQETIVIVLSGGLEEPVFSSSGGQPKLTHGQWKSPHGKWPGCDANELVWKDLFCLPSNAVHTSLDLLGKGSISGMIWITKWPLGSLSCSNVCAQGRLRDVERNTCVTLKLRRSFALKKQHPHHLGLDRIGTSTKPYRSQVTDAYWASPLVGVWVSMSN